MSILEKIIDTPLGGTVLQPEDELALFIEQSKPLSGTAQLSGAKNAVLVIMASLLLTEGKSRLYNIPSSADVYYMIQLLESLGAGVIFDEYNHILTIDTSSIAGYKIDQLLMKKMRASVLVMGPLLARFLRAEVMLPGGCLIGERPIDFHLKNFAKMGVSFSQEGECITAKTSRLQAARIVLEYPSVGATENTLMAACLTRGVTQIINAALEPEVIDLIGILRKMGARIAILPPAIIEIEGVEKLYPVEYSVMMDRLEAGSLLLAAAITKGSLILPEADASTMDVFLSKLEEMGHSVQCLGGRGIVFKATQSPKAVSFITGPYPGFPTDLQAPMMAVQTLADGVSKIHETVFENRLLHIRELEKMGALIKRSGDRVEVVGVDALYGARVIATDIRASMALVIAGMAAQGKSIVTGTKHWLRGYDKLEYKLRALGAQIELRKATN